LPPVASQPTEPQRAPQGDRQITLYRRFLALHRQNPKLKRVNRVSGKYPSCTRPRKELLLGERKKKCAGSFEAIPSGISRD
jgi:hypothetical protein